MRIMITGQARLLPEQRDQTLAAAAAMRAHTLTEPGCLEYRFWVEPGDPNSLLLFELWAEQAALDAHLADPNLPGFSKAFRVGLDGGFDLTRFEIASSGALR
jgi:quinol monooxygenase YgiN